MSNIQLAINWAINKCNASNIGYSQAYRNQQTVGGVTYYDCSSFIWYALKAAGFDVEKAYKTATGTAYSGNAITTHNMDKWLKALGFTRYDPTATAWQQGDVMLVHNDSHQHTEMVYDGAAKRCMGPNSGVRKTLLQPNSPRPAAYAATRISIMTSGCGLSGATGVLLNLSGSSHA